MIYCLACGTANEDGSRFCDECGDRLAAQGAQPGDVPPWVAEMEGTLRARAEAGGDGEPQEILEVPDWFRDLQASQPDRYVEDASQLGVDENESLPAWLAAVQGMQTSAEPPQAVAEPLQTEAESMQVEEEFVGTEADARQAAAEFLLAADEPPQATVDLPRAAARSPQAAAQPPQATPQPPQERTEPVQAGVEPVRAEPAQYAPTDRLPGEGFPGGLQELHATETEPEPAPFANESHGTEVQLTDRLVQAGTGEGGGGPELLVGEQDTAEQIPEWQGGSHPASVGEGDDEGAPTESGDSAQVLALGLNELRDEEGEPRDGGVLALEESSGAGELLKDLPDTLPVQAHIVQSPGMASPERGSAIPDRYASRARLFSDILAHPPEVAPIASAQPKSRSSRRLIMYAIFVVLAFVLGAILASRFGSHLAPVVAWFESIFDSLGGMIGG